MESTILISGFGGQGILFTGKFLVYIGMLIGKEVTWLPSYGPEMRGGTANCSVILSDEQIGSPIVTCPDILVCMNLPSLDKYEGQMKAGGMLFLDSSLIDRQVLRTDIKTFYIPATKLADDNEMKGLANMIMVGKLIKETAVCDKDVTAEAMKKAVPERKKTLFDANVRAIELGMAYK